MQFPPPSLFEDGNQEWAAEPSPSPMTARAEAAARIISEPVIDLKLVSKLARSGIPDKLRADYWKAMIGYYPPTRADWPEIRRRKAIEYMDIVRNVCPMNADDTVATVTRDVHRVDVDIPRTMPSMHFFAFDDTTVVDGVPVTFSPTQQSLRRILHTLARVNKGFGYVQGMNELAGHFLFAFAEGKAANVTLEVEGDVFFCFQTLLSILGDNFCRSLDFDRDTGVMNTIRTFDRLFEYCDPELWAHITDMNVKPEFYAFRWMTLLLTQEFLVPDVLRIWDYLFSYGSNMSAALFFCGVAMLIHQREELLAMENMSLVLPFLQQFPPVDIGELLDVAQKLIDEYGLEKIRQLKRESDSPTANGAAVGSGGEGKPSSPLSASSNSLSEVTQKIGGLMTAMKAFSGQHLFKSPSGAKNS